MKSPNHDRNSYGIFTYLYYTLLTLALCVSFSVNSQQLAFPTAEGFGKFATGGRGGAVIKVTNLNNSGTGSLRNALLTPGPRTIVFEVGGTITLTSAIYVTDGNFTLAGQTAPGDGILIKGSMIQVEASNAIIRYIRFRPGNSAANTADGLSITAWTGNVVEDIIVDHCSISWADDENFDIRAVNSGIVRDVTLQYSIVAESGYGSLSGQRTSNKTFYKNLFIHNNERNIRSNYPDGNNFDFEMINNIIYGFRWATSPSLGGKFTVLNNHYRASSQVTVYGAMVDGTTSGQGTPSLTHAYVSGNITAANNPEYSSLIAPYIQSTPYATSGINAIPASNVADDILSHVGCSFPSRDAVDIRLLDQYNNGNGVLASIGTYPTIANGTAPTDTDDDGMPDSWETQNGLNPNDPTDRNIVQPDGYTNLEYYLNGMVLDTTGGQVNISSNATNDTICEGADVVLTATGADSYVWNTGATTASITVAPNTTNTYSVTGTHSDSSTSQDSITITVNEVPISNAGEDVETCQGTAVTLTASGGSNYQWSTGSTNQSIVVNPNTTTTYTVQVTQNGCTSSDSVVVTVIEQPTVDAGPDQTIFFGESAVLIATGADSYLWSTGETTQSITVNPALDTSYSVTGYIGNCESTDTVTVTVLDDNVNANAGADTEICNGETVTLTATGGTTYLWNTGATTASINVTPNTTTIYTVTAFSPSGNNTDTDSVTVTVNEIPNVSAGVDVTINEGESTTLTATGADTYLWNTGETTASISVSPNNTTIYSVTGFSNGCESSDDVTVTVNIESVVAFAGDDVSICFGESTTLTATGGSSYLWNTGATTASISVSPNNTTTYTVTAFNTNQTASDTDMVTVTVNDLPNTFAGNDVTIIEGESTTLTATGADTYLWNTGQTTASISVSPNSTTVYSVTGFSNGCESLDDVTVTVNIENVTANAGDDVSICIGESTTLTASGGLSYLWNTGETSASISVSPNSTTTYTVTVFNTNQTASDTDSVIVTVNDLPNTFAGNDVTIIEGESTTLTATGADTYLWNTGETTASILVSPNSTTVYSVTGFSNGCESSDDVMVTVNIENVTANAGDDVSICVGESAVLTATGGSSYLWNTGETSASISVSPNSTTTYTVTAFNTNETASDTDTVTVIVNDLPSTFAGNDVTIIEGESTTLTATGADSYLWSTGATSATIEVNPNITTTYSVTGFSNGCESTDDVTVIVEPFNFTASAGGDQVICQGYNTTLTASQGDSYLWSTGETTQSITVNPTNTQTYTVTVFLGNYQDDADVTVTVNPNPNVVIANGDEVMILEGEFITLSASGANSYVWNNGATQPNIAVSPTETTTYEVTGFINNCEDTKAVVVNVFENVVADAGDDVTICSQETVTLTASGGDEYLWNTGETTPSIEVSPESDTDYSVLVYNALSSDETFVTVFVEDCSPVQLPPENENFDFLVYQDVTQDVLKVKINGLQSVNAKGITVYDISGKIIHDETFRQAELENQSEMLKEINTTPYARGIYVVRLEYNDTSVIKKIPIR